MTGWGCCWYILFLAHVSVLICFFFFALNYQGDGYAVNVPLDSGVDDSVLVPMFRSIITKAKAVFAPEAIVLQCGASLLPGNGPSNMTCR